MPASPAADEDFENARKRQIDNDQAPNQCGPPVKKARLSNGYDGFEPTPMEVDDDQNGDENAYPSPEQAPSPVIVTIGPEQGTQVDKVHELSTETTFLELSDDPSSRNAVLLQCEFNPRDPTILAAAGTDALARMWTLSRILPDPGSESPRKPVFASAHNLLDDSAPSTTTATGLSWSSDGQYIAVSSEPQDEGNAKVEFWDKNAASFAEFNSFESPIMCLRWNLANTACLAISPQDEGRGTLLTVMLPNRVTSLSYSLPNHSLDQQVLDAVWTGNDEFFICGGTLLVAYHCTEEAISQVRKYETRDNDTLSKITYDWRSGLVATANDSGMIDVSQIHERLYVLADLWVDLGPIWEKPFFQCSPRYHHLVGLATYTVSCDYRRRHGAIAGVMWRGWGHKHLERPLFRFQVEVLNDDGICSGSRFIYS
jgi:hypothetical protein